MSPDAVVIGAGANGLVAAHMLARAGRSVLVLEQQEKPDRGVDAGWVPPGVIRDLDLAADGLQTYDDDPWASAALDGGERLDLWRDVRKSADAIRRLSSRDADRWPEFCERMHSLARMLESLYQQPAPDIEHLSLGELTRLGGLGLSVRRMGRQAVVDALRILPMSVADLLDDWFENDVLKGVLGASGIMHLCQGPRGGGTAFNLLHHHVGSPVGVFRPRRSNLTDVLGRRRGVEVRHGAQVTRILVKGGRVTGVAAADGEEIAARLVFSSAGPRATLLGMIEPGWLDPDMVRAVVNIRCRGVAARVTCSVQGDPGFGVLAVAQSLEYLEKAYDDAKYGRVSAAPYMEARSGNGELEIHVQYTPYALRDGTWNDERRHALGLKVVPLLSDAAPVLRGRLDVKEVLTPCDLEERYGLTEGHAYQGELALDQILFMRPVPGWSRYRTSVAGLYLCGTGAHPGGAVPGGAGWLAVKEALR